MRSMMLCLFGSPWEMIFASWNIFYNLIIMWTCAPPTQREPPLCEILSPVPKGGRKRNVNVEKREKKITLGIPHVWFVRTVLVAQTYICAPAPQPSSGYVNVNMRTTAEFLHEQRVCLLIRCSSYEKELRERFLFFGRAREKQ